MPSTRTDLTNYGPNSSYIFLTIFFTILSVVGILLFFQIINLSPANQAASTITPMEEGPPPIETEAPVPPSSAPTLADSLPSSTPSPATPTPTPQFQSFSSPEDKFSVAYSSDRKVYQDKESSGRRYTFYRAGGNIAVHTGTSWSWIHPGREFTDNLKIDSQATFRYDITNQTIVDIEANDLKYTIQCLHGGADGLKVECEDFIAAFKLSP